MLGYSWDIPWNVPFKSTAWQECNLTNLKLHRGITTYTLQDALQQKQRDNSSRLTMKLETWRKTCSSSFPHSYQPTAKQSKNSCYLHLQCPDVKNDYKSTSLLYYDELHQAKGLFNYCSCVQVLSQVSAVSTTIPKIRCLIFIRYSVPSGILPACLNNPVHSLDNAMQEFSLAYPSWNMSNTIF